MQQHDFSTSSSSKPPSQPIAVSRCDRWQIHQRLTELDIHSTCHPNGAFEVEVYSPVSVVQIHSVLSQFTASRQQRVGWLNQCWQRS